MIKSDITDIRDVYFDIYVINRKYAALCAVLNPDA